MMRDEIPRLNELADRLDFVAATSRLEPYLTPRNRVEEEARSQQALDTGHRYDPRFVYEEPPAGFEAGLRELLTAVDPARTSFDALVAADLERSIRSVDAARRRDPGAITAATADLFGTPDDRLVDRARTILAAPGDPPPEAPVDAVAAARHLRDSLARAQLVEWTVVLDDRMNARMSVHSATSTVRVAASAKFTTSELRRLSVHELGTHVARAENGKRQPLRLLGAGLLGYLSTEEGLACWHEERFTGLDAVAMRRYALRAIAVHRSRDAGFAEVLADLVRYTSHHEAFSILVRAKRGITDTAAPGAFVKDHVYLQGYLEVTEHLGEHPRDHELLLTGRIGLGHLPLVRELESLGLLLPPAFRPEHFLPADEE